MSYQIGKVYVWVSDNPDIACLRGTECTVTGRIEYYHASDNSWNVGQATDAKYPGLKVNHTVMAKSGELHPKEPPSGEQLVMDKFNVPDLVPA